MAASHPLLELTIEQASSCILTGSFRSVYLTKAYLARIDEASSFKSVLQVNPDALSMAQGLEDELHQTGPRRSVARLNSYLSTPLN